MFWAKKTEFETLKKRSRENFQIINKFLIEEINMIWEEIDKQKREIANWETTTKEAMQTILKNWEIKAATINKTLNNAIQKRKRQLKEEQNETICN